ncbi:MAG: stage IV sporulation protein A [Clostridia bacterium]|nr:stage IV sporulation protein A [Clostridia bacterium]
MNSNNIYDDISTRTSGDIYLGVVGPVRCGKSTFITNFMNEMVLPNITNDYDKIRTVDELPQSADGKTIMTTQPRFVPKEAVKITVNEKVNLKIRLVDCVGYTVSGAEGLVENNKPRLVKTPWSDKSLSFEDAAEIGTKKVITDHSTIAVVLTTDGSFGELQRKSFVDAENKAILELKALGKPFVVVINSARPKDEDTLSLRESLSKKYEIPVITLDVLNLTQQNINEIFSNILQEFPLYSLRVKMPSWLQALPYDDELIQEIVAQSKYIIDKTRKIGELDSEKMAFEASENFETVSMAGIDMGKGIAYLDIKPKQDLFYKVLSRECDQKISSDFELVTYIKKLAYAKGEYDKFSEALSQVEETGYGVVSPKIEEMTLEEPEMVKQGSRYGVRLKASAPSWHIMKVDVETEISPIVGSEQQSEELVKYLLKEFENNPKSLWDTNMFGKSMHSLVNEGLNKKIVQMPVEAQRKIRKTLSRIVNEGKGGIICILL